MIKINNFSIEHWYHIKQWFVAFPDGSGVGIPDKYSLRIVLKYVLFWIQYGYKSMYEL